jgi:TRAP-type C4-dicarboxylate transport system substrate-binding protein
MSPPNDAPAPHPPSLARRLRARVAAALLAAAVVPVAAQTAATTHLRIVGGFGVVNQYTRHEEPFWTRELPRLTQGKASAEIVPFDRAGLRGQEMLRLVQLGAVPFGTSLLNLSALHDPEIGAPDLAALNPDIASLRRTIDAFRPRLAALLRERYGIELLAIYAYPAQVTFCAKPLTRLADLAGRRIRVSSTTQSDWVTALGATPVQTPFGEIVANVKRGNIDCAITGTMSGNTIGLQEVTTHLHTMPVNWGLAAFVANGSVWASLPKDLRSLLERELPRLERAIRAEAENETAEGIACNSGASTCATGRKGSMMIVRPSAADAKAQRDMLGASILPAYLKRCGQGCALAFRDTIGAAHGVDLP